MPGQLSPRASRSKDVVRRKPPHSRCTRLRSHGSASALPRPTFISRGRLALRAAATPLLPYRRSINWLRFKRGSAGQRPTMTGPDRFRFSTMPPKPGSRRQKERVRGGAVAARGSRTGRLDRQTSRHAGRDSAGARDAGRSAARTQATGTGVEGIRGCS